jgi:hypothetical protein
VDNEAIRRFVSLARRKKDLDAALKEATKGAGRGAGKPPSKRCWRRAYSAVDVDGRHVKLSQKASAKPAEDRAAMIEALKTSSHQRPGGGGLQHPDARFGG